LLGLTRKAQLAINRRSLTKRCDTHRGLTASRYQGSEKRSRDRGQRDVTALTLLGQTTCNVPLSHVRDFVRHDTRDLGLRARTHDESRMHTNEASGHRESIDFWISDTKHLDLRCAAGGVCTQLAAHIFEILAHIRIADVFGIAPPLNHDGFAKLAF
jgi:hypothetical protein